MLEIQSTIQYIPNSYEMGGTGDDRKNVMLITGPNMGGKSTYMRQVVVRLLVYHSLASSSS